MAIEKFAASDTPDSLTQGQLMQLVNADFEIFFKFVRTTSFDVSRIRLLIEMGQIEANKRWCASNS